MGGGADPLHGPATFAGRFDLGAFSPAGVPVEIHDLSGKLLAQSETDAAGNYHFHDFYAPSDFRVTARLSRGQEFSSEVRGFSNSGKVVGLNIPTSLASAYIQSHPGETLESAEARVRRVLHFAPDRPLDQESEESPRSHFSQYAFFVRAAQNGGWPNYRDKLLSLMESGADSPVFTLRRADLEADLSNLAPEIAHALVDLRRDTRFRRSFFSLATHPVPDLFGRVTGTSRNSQEIVSENSPQAAVLAKSNFSLLDTLAAHVVDGVVNQAVDDSWTHVADGLNLNYGTTAKLDAIQDSLNEMQVFLNDLSAHVDQDALFDSASTISQDVSTIATLNNALFSSRASQYISEKEQPFTRSSPVEALVESLLGFDAEVALRDIQAAMLGLGGQQPYLAAARDNLMTNVYGVNSGPTYGNFGILSNSIVDSSLQPFTYYASYQQLAANILGELSHLGTEATTSRNPVTDMNQVSGPIYDAIIATKKQRGLLPFYILQDNVFVDLQSGLMWYTVLQPENSTSGASKAAFNKSVTVRADTQLLTKESEQPQGLPTNSVTFTYDDWHLATYDELETLQLRARYLQDTSLRDNSLPGGSDTGVGDYDSAIRSLSAFGFKGLEALNDNGSMLFAEWSVRADHSWSLNGTSGFEPNSEFLFNQKLSLGATTKARPYLICRNIGQPVFEYNKVNNTTPNTPYPTTDWYRDLVLEEYPILGHVTAVHSVADLSSSQLAASLEWTVNVGGSYTVGVGGSESVKLHSRSYTYKARTYDGQDYNSFALNDLNDLVWYTSSDESILSVTPSGRMYWHVDPSANPSVSVTGHAYTRDGKEVTYTGTVSRARAREFLRIQIFPRNRSYEVISGSTKVTEPYYCVAFYTDNTSEDVTGQVTWTLVNDDENETAVDSGLATLATNPDSNAGTFVGDTPRNDTTLKIKASLGPDPDANDEVLLRLSNGVNDPDPNGV